jgi:hypothetical protein
MQSLEKDLNLIDASPSFLIDSIANPRWKQWKDKELRCIFPSS